MPEQALVTVMIVTRDRPEELKTTLQQLRSQIYRPWECIVIDDCSSPANSKRVETIVQQLFPGARYSRNAKHLGLVASRSTALNSASGRYVVSLDDDSCFTDPNDLTRAVSYIEAHPRTGVVAFRIHNGPGPIPPAARAASHERFLPSFTGCGFLLRKAATDQVGAFSDFLFYYGEETELSLRLWDAGWQVRYFPSVVVHHRISNQGRSDGRIFAYAFRNSIWTMLLRMPARRLPLELGWKVAVFAWETVRRLEFRWALWSIGSCIGGLPGILRRRSPVSPATTSLFDALRLRHVSTTRDPGTLPPTRLRDVWNWFWGTWRQRRRLRSAWNSEQGPIGRSDVATFSGPHIL